MDARENYFLRIDFNSLEMISASSRADANARMNTSAIDDIPPQTYLQTPDSIQNSTINHTMLQLTNIDTLGFFSNSIFSTCTFQFTYSHMYML